MSAVSIADPTRSVPVVRGDRTLPAGYDHPHASETARRLAERGQILRVQVGSGVHGTAIGGQDDRDEMGICLEPPEFVTGLARVPAGVRAEAAAGDGPVGSEGPDFSAGQPGTVPFKQYQRHTVWDRPGGLANRSGAGDLDVVVYSLRKWCRLALAGNPTVLLVLFVPDEEVVVRDTVGCELVANAHRFVSRLAGDRFLGYLASQRASMVGAGARTNRPELVAAHGYDTKFAMHALRLGFQGAELLRTGRITLPVPEPALSELRAVRRGEVPLEQAVRRIDEVAAELADLNASPRVPDQPDRSWVDAFLHRAHLAYWADPDGQRFGS